MNTRSLFLDVNWPHRLSSPLCFFSWKKFQKNLAAGSEPAWGERDSISHLELSRKLLWESPSAYPVHDAWLRVLDGFNFQWRESSWVFLWNGPVHWEPIPQTWLVHPCPGSSKWVTPSRSLASDSQSQESSLTRLDCVWLGSASDRLQAPWDPNRFSIFSHVCLIPREGSNQASVNILMQWHDTYPQSGLVIAFLKC